MKKTNLLLFILLINSFLCVAQKQWDYERFTWCDTVPPAQLELLAQKSKLVVVGDSVLINYEDTIVSKATKWVKKQAECNCLSADPNDCLVWCLTEVPAVTVTRQRKVAKNFAGIIEINKGVYVERRNYNKAVISYICKENEASIIEKALFKALVKHGKLRKRQMSESNEDYFLFCKKNYLTALIEYQKENELPEGFLDIETLRALNIINE